MHRRDVLDALVAAVRAEDPGQLLVTGDLVHIGLAAEIEAAADWLESLGDPSRVMLVPGNHDVYAADSWKTLARCWGSYLPAAGAGAPPDAAFPVVRRLDCAGGPLNLIGVSSAVPSPLFMATGHLGGGQQRRLAGLLDELGGFRCLLIHHPPLPGQTSWRKGLRDAAALQGVLAERGAELVLHGHTHRNVATRGPGGVRVYGTASASSAHAGAPAAYRSFDIHYADDGWRVHMRLVTVTAAGSTLQAEERWQTDVRTASAP